LQVTALTHRANAVMTAMVRSTEPNEASLVSRMLARIFLPATRIVIPSLVDYDLPLAGGGRYLVVASIEKHYAGQVQRVSALSHAAPALAAARLLVIVDHNVNVRDLAQVLQAIATHARPDLDFSRHLGFLDPSDPMLAYNELAPRMTIDATRKFIGESGRRAVITTGSMPNDIIESVSARWAEFGLGPA
jgi:4-hydroxy-3-polyprenylbenzoate decarboxylase